MSSHIQINKDESATLITSGDHAYMGENLAYGFLCNRRSSPARPRIQIFQEEFFRPVVATSPFTDNHVISIDNYTLYGLAPGMWSRYGNIAYQADRDIQTSQVWINCYTAHPAHVGFSCYKQAGFGRET